MREEGLTGAETAPNHEHDKETRPRIYVASLSDYNHGRMHGAWITADQDTETVEGEITAMLEASPAPGAEEWAIHDHEGFGGLHLGEYEPIARVAAIARGITEHGSAFAHWAAYLGHDTERLEDFEDHYRGSWDSITDFAEELLDDIGVDIDALVPEHLAPYVSFDLEAFGRDLNFDFYVSDDEDGVHVFEHI